MDGRRPHAPACAHRLRPSNGKWARKRATATGLVADRQRTGSHFRTKEGPRDGRNKATTAVAKDDVVACIAKLLTEAMWAQGVGDPLNHGKSAPIRG